nr:MAG TPA: hypothetical protein [Caudoviricetes sp.]
MGSLIVMAISPQADKEVLNVRHLHHQTDGERRLRIHWQDVTTSS